MNIFKPRGSGEAKSGGERASLAFVPMEPKAREALEDKKREHRNAQQLIGEIEAKREVVLAQLELGRGEATENDLNEIDADLARQRAKVERLRAGEAELARQLDAAIEVDQSRARQLLYADLAQRADETKATLAEGFALLEQSAERLHRALTQVQALATDHPDTLARLGAPPLVAERVLDKLARIADLVIVPSHHRTRGVGPGAPRVGEEIAGILLIVERLGAEVDPLAIPREEIERAAAV